MTTVEFKVITVLQMQAETSMHEKTDVILNVGENLDAEMYINAEGRPNEDGSKIITGTLVQGLISNIHYAHQEKIWDSAEHLRHIIEELERGFVEVVNIVK